MNMTSNCDVTNSTIQIQMTIMCHSMKTPQWKFSAYATGGSATFCALRSGLSLVLFCRPALNKITRGLFRSLKNMITQSSRKCFQNWKRTSRKDFMHFWRKLDEIFVSWYFWQEKCTLYWKTNSYFCASLTVQTVLKSWSLAVGGPAIRPGLAGTVPD